MIGFLTSVAHVPGWTGQYVNAGWLALAGSLPFVLRRTEMTVCHWLGLAFLAYAGASLLWTPELHLGLIKLGQFILIAGAFWYGSVAKSLTTLYIGLAIGVSVSSIIAIAQVFGFDGILQTSIPGGLFGNSGIMARTAAIVLIPLALEGLWWYVPGPALAVVLGGSRAAWLVLAIPAILSRRWIGALIAAAVIFIACVISFTRYDNVRFEIWTEILRTATLFGHGIGSFGFDTSAGYVLHAQNDFLELFSELGVGVGLLLSVLILVSSGGNETARVTLLAVIFVSLFSMPLFIPTTALIAGAVAGHLTRGLQHGTLATHDRTLLECAWDRMGIQRDRS